MGLYSQLTLRIMSYTSISEYFNVRDWSERATAGEIPYIEENSWKSNVDSFWMAKEEGGT